MIREFFLMQLSQKHKVELTHLQFPVDFMENEERPYYNYALFFFC